MPVLTPPKDHPSTLPLTDRLTLNKKIRSVNELGATYETLEYQQVNAIHPEITLLLARRVNACARERTQAITSSNQRIEKGGDAVRIIASLLTDRGVARVISI